ncbi:hypothetical protein [Paenibacillus etheri]|uniref:hypothetical protein n=1 Tax=Paenibacillus etheri TaxID=1306852 RepID=UPI000AA172FF|nr:hypothetical protein [Paenibacillus etheri]
MMQAARKLLIDQGFDFETDGSCSISGLWIGVGGQEHSPIRTRAWRGFSILWGQVLVLCLGQELDPISDFMII